MTATLPSKTIAPDELLYASCEGALTYPTSPLHLRAVPERGDLYFGGGLTAAGITAACGAAVNWDNHIYSDIEIRYFVPSQPHAFHFCVGCINILQLNQPQ